MTNTRKNKYIVTYEDVVRGRVIVDIETKELAREKYIYADDFGNEEKVIKRRVISLVKVKL